MLSCKKCGAQMSGTDLVCKKCGTPWGKKHKSKSHVYLSMLVILLTACAAYVYFTPNIDKTPLIDLYNKYLVHHEENTAILPVEESPMPNNTIPTPLEENNTLQNNIETEEEIITSPQSEPIPQLEPQPPHFSWISASSFLKEQNGFSYIPENTVDGMLNTAWLEGIKGNGIGEWIMYSAETEQLLSSITLFNGYLKNNTTYVSNGKIKKLSVELSDGSILTYDIPKSNFSESKNGVKFTFDEPVKTSFVKITILDIYTGSYYTDTALSGISFE